MIHSNKIQRPSDARSRRTKLAIGDGLFDLLDDSDFSEITVNDICLASEVSRSTFYAHFEDKYHLLRFKFNQIDEEIKNKTSSEDDTDLIPAIIEVISFYQKPLKHLLLGESNKELEQMLQLFFVDRLKDQLEIYQRNGIKFETPIYVTATFLAAGLSHLLLWWIQGDFPATKEVFSSYLKSLLSLHLDLK